MAIATRSTRETEAKLDQWRAAVQRCAATGDLFSEALHALRLAYAEIDREIGAEAAGLAYAVPGACVACSRAPTARARVGLSWSCRTLAACTRAGEPNG